ncbi:MAG TPA: ABC transporter substrate-binding protein [Bryobacteraceae bacterium]|nr:ABC transporter substrate-binding protein [Bryobacteraceae bacterium]
MRKLLSLLVFALWLSAEPRRIVSTAPSFTETLYAIGAGDRVIGVSVHCHFPERVKTLPKVGTYIRPNIEAIVRLKPDLVLVHRDQQRVAEQLNRLGIATLGLTNTGLEDTFTTIREAGAALNLTGEAMKLEQSIRVRLEALRRASSGQAGRSLVFVVGRRPGRLEGLVAVGKGSFLNELITIAGGRNALADSPITYPRISLEAVLRIDPDVIVDMGDMAETVGVTEAHKQEVVKLWQSQNDLKAVITGRVYAVAADIFVVPGPRMAEAAEEFAKMLQEAR